MASDCYAFVDGRKIEKKISSNLKEAVLDNTAQLLDLIPEDVEFT